MVISLRHVLTEFDANSGGQQAEEVEVVDVRSILYPELRSILRESVPVISISEANFMSEEGSFQLSGVNLRNVFSFFLTRVALFACTSILALI